MMNVRSTLKNHLPYVVPSFLSVLPFYGRLCSIIVNNYIHHCACMKQLISKEITNTILTSYMLAVNWKFQKIALWDTSKFALLYTDYKSNNWNITDTCSQPKVEGSCRGSFRRWWYDRRSGRCEEFVYSGCQGNENRFATQDDCNMKCVNSNEKGWCPFTHYFHLNVNSFV